MIFNVLIFLVIVLTTMYLATQGMVSSMIALVTAMFSSVLAMALMEPLQGIIGGFRPDYGRGVTFLLLFLFIFSATRIAGDIAVKKNITLNLWVNRGMGAFFGFFTALVVAGTIVIGIEMLPVSRILLGFDRYPSPGVMAAVDAEGKPIAGEVTSRRSSIWFSPDGFVLALWNAASGRALGGNTSWDSVHPDITVEAYGYRYPVFPGSSRTAPHDLVKVLNAWSSSDPKEYSARGIPAQGGKKVVMVRAEVQKGDKPPHATFDNDGFFRVTAAQVRLVTNEGHQYYPIGNLFQGRQFESLPLSSGFIVDDYVSKTSANSAIQDWVFAIPEGETAAIFELKTAREPNLAALMKQEPLAPLRVADYPPRGYYKDLCTLTVTFDPVNAEMLSGRVYVLKPDAKIRDIHGALRKAKDEINAIRDNISNSTGGWSSDFKPGVPNSGAYRLAFNNAEKHLTDKDEDVAPWFNVLPPLLLSQTFPDGRQNLTALPQYMKREVESLWASVRSGSIVSGVADADNSDGGAWKATVRRITPTPHPVIITMETKTSFYVWVTQPDFGGNGATTSPGKEVPLLVVGDPANAGNGRAFYIDLNEKPPTP